jgi:transposase
MSPATDITRAKKKPQENGDSCESYQTGPNDKPKKRKIGAQKGHKRHARPKFKRDEANEINEFPPENTTCPKCQNQMERCPEKDRQHDQIEIPEIVIRKLIYLALAYRCPKCGKIHYGNIPENVIKTGFVGVNLQALITLLNTSCAVSIRKIQMVIQDVAGCKISTGLINKVRMGTSKALKPAFEEACKELQNQEIINSDETSHPDSGKKHWLWAFIGRFLAVYKIGTRSAFLLEEFLGTTFKGIIGCDYHGAYRKFKKGNPAVKLQFCMAHLIRDCQYCFDYNNYKVREYGKKLLDLLTEMFHVYHKYRESNDPKDLEELQEFAPKITSAALDSPMISKSKGIAKRFQDNPEGYFTFMFHPGVEPTNNRAEQGIRGAVVNRKMTMGTRGEAGRAYTEIMLTVMQTCLKTGNSQHKFIKDSLNAYYEGREQPSLVALANEASSRLTSENQSPSSPKQAA